MTDRIAVMDRLKTATAAQHRDAESRRLQAELVRGRLPDDAYARWLGQMFLLHRALAEEIAQHRAACRALADVVQDDGRHVANLRADLDKLGLEADAVRPLPSMAQAIAAIRETAGARPIALLGYNYVLEGSMNGNRFIARALATNLRVPAVSYLDPYGDTQRAIWTAYRERMNAADLHATEADVIVEAAQRMFTFVTDLSDELLPGAAGS